ncbi:MAG TPA: TonB-dependent receptor [Steroidobacteraceae bacterium]|nr:TonB-dependent receptor [Steroidobacteraceae bacterium]
MFSRATWAKGAWIAVIALAALVGAPAIHAQGMIGLPLTQAIAALEKRGVSVVYTTDLVKPWMQVTAEPAAGDPTAMLNEILAPFGLATRAGPNGVLLVVRVARAQNFKSAAPATGDGMPVAAAPVSELVVVTARPYLLTRGSSLSPRSLSATDIANLPDLGDDALRAVARLPGTTTDGVSAETHIRGGDTNEALVRFDGLRLHNPFHLKDFQSIFSAIDPSLIGSVDVYTGALPADAGDRMSGLIDIHSLTPPGPRYREISASLFNLSALGSGEFAGGKGSWLVTGRRSNLDVWYHAFSKESGTPTYNDAFGKLSYEIGAGSRITANVLYITDDVTLADEDGDERAAAEFADSYLWLRLDQHPGERLSGSTWLSHTRLASHRYGSSVQTGVSVGSLDDQRRFTIDSLQSQWSWRAADQWSLQLGGEAARTTGSYDYRDVAQLAVLLDTPGASDETSRARSIQVEPDGSRIGLYVNLRYQAVPAFTADIGLRWDRQTLDPGGYAPWSPRVGLRYLWRERTELRAGWARAYQSQNIDELQVSDGVTTFFSPERTDHLTLGFEHRSESGVTLRAEIYDKDIAHPRPRYENLLNTLTLLPELKPDRVLIAPQSAHARGLEIYLQRKDAGPVGWWLGYSWSSVRDQVDEGAVPRSWDQRHAVSAGLNLNVRKWTLALAVLYRSGWRTTHVELDTASATPVLLAGPRNALRLGYFASADFRIARRFDLDHSSLSAFVEVSNFLGRANPCCTAFEIDDETGTLELERRDYLPVIPSLGVLWQF